MASNVYTNSAGLMYTAATPQAAGDMQHLSPHPTLVSVLSATPVQPATVKSAFISAMKTSNAVKNETGWMA